MPISTDELKLHKNHTRLPCELTTRQAEGYRAAGGKDSSGRQEVALYQNTDENKNRTGGGQMSKETHKSRVYTERPAYADFDAPAKFEGRLEAVISSR